MKESTDPSTQQIAVFRVGQYGCALSVSCVQEINRNVQVTPVHQAAHYVRGIINLRGQIVTVIDLQRKLGLGALKPSAQMRNVVVKSDQEMVGLLVSDVDDVIEVAPEEILPAPPHFAQELGGCLTGVYQLGSELIAVLDMDRVLRDDESR